LDYVPAATGRNVLGVVGYRGDYPSKDDLTTFMNKHRIDGDDATFTLVQIRGGNLRVPGEPNQEANVDTQYTEASLARTRPHSSTTAPSALASKATSSGSNT